MDLLKTLCALFAMAAGTTPEALTAHLTELKAQVDGTAALKAKLGLPESADLAALGTKIEALKAGATQADATTVQAMAALQTQLATLTAQINGDKVTQLVDSALLAGKLVPAMRDWALELGRKDMAQLQGYIDKAPALAGALQSGGKPPAGDDKGGTAALSAAAADVIARMGITPEMYAAAGKA